MATKNMIFEAVRKNTSREIKKLCKMKFADIFWNENVLMYTKKSLQSTPEVYSEVMPLCTPITTVDGVEVYVAYKKVYIIGSNPVQYRNMCKEYNFVDEVYYDVTHIFNGRTVCIDSVNWADRSKSRIVKVHSCKLPWLRKSRLFYTQG